ncbi:unnamed protein product [Orchesella dallaii]|uniref:Uncharacterized protein n=1 Tax=Orchesella dallaii TaxID=48710 RepID=A0ABP1Q920_9HEXA
MLKLIQNYSTFFCSPQFKLPLAWSSAVSNEGGLEKFKKLNLVPSQYRRRVGRSHATFGGIMMFTLSEPHRKFMN